ncbi:hypothetical protein CHS0354_006506 [Potamilus streckersoni]|uniref:C-type lectin domain-containing protein n=1 Tax=Potamilus streckersoni TaxID=2493646 RepID=A0AAE0TBJ4_9BIVA|nr:hypothetical protein CHS0354_006506 [Potamilus streckersoni]
MKLVQVAFLCLSLSALADGLVSPQSGFGFGGFSGIFGLFILLIFLAALSRKPKCPDNYIPVSPTSNTCIRFFTTTKTFSDARTTCQNDGGDLLKPDVVDFDLIRAHADANKGDGTCDFWIGAREAAIGVWSDLNGKSIPTLGGLFFEVFDDFDDNAANECAVMDHTRSFYLYGETCTNLNCYICAKDKTF